MIIPQFDEWIRYSVDHGLEIFEGNDCYFAYKDEPYHIIVGRFSGVVGFLDDKLLRLFYNDQFSRV